MPWTLVTVVLVAAGSALLASSILEGRYARSAQLAVGLALVVAGYVLRAADVFGLLPDLLVEGVDDEDAVATLLGLAALLLGGTMLLLPAADAVDPGAQWVVAGFALLVLVVLAVEVVFTFSLED